MAKLRKFEIFAVMIFHLPLLLVFRQSTAEGWMYVSAVLLALFADIALSFHQTKTFTAQYENLRGYVAAFSPYFLEKCIIIAAEFGICRLLKADREQEEQIRYLLWWLFSMGTAALAAVVTFVTGAARTMLYHDDRGK
ncbi:MAG: hypothetical protein IK130_07530 [Oscillospiraceae bacterium]|nr:hypothetical protein [Oscillospiraceae bacterium]